MKRELKIGDRVKVYGNADPHIGESHFYFDGREGKVVEITSENEVVVTILGDRGALKYTVHPKQCRRVVPNKKKPEITYEKLRFAWENANLTNNPPEKSRHFRDFINYLGIEPPQQDE